MTKTRLNCETLEDRELLTTFVFADLDTGARPLATLPSSTGLPPIALGNYLQTTQFDCRTVGQWIPQGNIDWDSQYQKGTLLQAYAAGAMARSPYTSMIYRTHESVVVSDSAFHQPSSDQIGNALEFVASQQAYCNARGIDQRYVAVIPWQESWPTYYLEMKGQADCAAQGVLVVRAAGDSYGANAPSIYGNATVIVQAGIPGSQPALWPMSNTNNFGVNAAVVGNYWGTQAGSELVAAQSVIDMAVSGVVNDPYRIVRTLRTYRNISNTPTYLPLVS